MPVVPHATIYDDLLELLSATANESEELEAFAHFEHVVRMLKARLLQRTGA